jgi:hypothetical protein
MICRSRNLEQKIRRELCDKYRASLGSRMGNYGHRYATLPRTIEEARRFQAVCPGGFVTYMDAVRGCVPKGSAPFATDAERAAAMVAADATPAPVPGQRSETAPSADF